MYDKSQSNKQDDVLRLGRKTVDSKIKALRGKEHTRRGINDRTVINKPRKTDV